MSLLVQGGSLQQVVKVRPARTRLSGNWERWLDFFAEGIERSATQALLALVQTDRDRIATLGRTAPSALALHTALRAGPSPRPRRSGAPPGCPRPR